MARTLPYGHGPVRAGIGVLAVAAALMVRGAETTPGPVTVFPTTAARGTNVRVTVPNAPAVNEATIRLISRTGPVPPFPATSVKDHTIEFTVPPTIQLGSYSITVVLGGNEYQASGEWLKVQPAPDWRVQLLKADPDSTYDTEPVWTLDRTKPLSDARPLYVADVVLRGFTPADNKVPEQIVVMGKREPVVIEPCSTMATPGTKEYPAQNAIYGESVAGTIRLCHVPIPGNGQPDIRIGNTQVDAAVEKTQTVWTPDYKPHQVRTARLKLIGTGFLPDRPEDNEILLNGTHVHIKWDTCQQLPPAGTKERPAEIEIHGQVVSPDEIDLCRVPVPDDGDMLFSVREGDLVSEPRAFKVFRYSKVLVSTASAIAAAVLGLLVLVLVGFVKKHHVGEPRAGRLKMLFLDPETNTYSLSKLQFYLWTGAAVFGYAYLVISKMLVQRESWPDIPATLPGIIAIGAGTAIGSQVVTSVRGPKGSGPESPNFSDFVTSGGVVAPDRIQMLIWTLFGVGAFCLAVMQQTPGAIKELSPVPQGMLYLMGLSSVGYLGGKLARKPGPIINEISITPSESDEAVLGEAAAHAAMPPSLVQPASEAQEILQGLPPVALPNAQKAVAALNEALTLSKAAKTASDSNILITKLGGLRSVAEAAATAAANDYAQPGAAQESAGAAEIAQKAAAAIQDLSAGVTQAVALATRAADACQKLGFTRVIELKGRNLCAEALLEIGGTELPSRMLVPQDGKKMPQVIVREPDNPSMARVLRLSIDASALEAPDLTQYKRWFGRNTVEPLTLTLTNPDGQKADITFAIPPGAAQADAKTGNEPVAAVPAVARAEAS